MEIITNIVELMDGEPRVSHRIIAKETDNNQVSVRKLIDKHSANLELFGQLSFEMTAVENSVKATNQEKTYFLNEQQATLLLTFMRNNEIVINFKVRLVKDFFEMRQKLQSKDSFEQRKEQFQLDVIGLESSFKLLRVNEV